MSSKMNSLSSDSASSPSPSPSGGASTGCITSSSLSPSPSPSGASSDSSLDSSSNVKPSSSGGAANKRGDQPMVKAKQGNSKPHRSRLRCRVMNVSLCCRASRSSIDQDLFGHQHRSHANGGERRGVLPLRGRLLADQRIDHVLGVPREAHRL